MTSPLPPGMASLLASTGTNASLFFYRGFGGYAPDFGKRPADAREGFFGDFRRHLEAVDPADYRSFIERRRAVLERLGATTLDLVSTQPLVLGLGLPHPTETGLLLDRLTGCPYVPGSSLKGVLRRAASLAAAGELAVAGHAEATDYWKRRVDPIFGPPIGPGATPATGRVIVYDAFPTSWPKLALDILTPHHTAYYGDPSKSPGDWEEPTPVPFLTVETGTTFRFAFGPRRSGGLDGDDVAALRHLLLAALDWLGVGGKAASQGYGTFAPHGTDARITVVSSAAAPVSPRRTYPPTPSTEVKAAPPPKVKGHSYWTNVELSLEGRKATIWHGRNEKAEGDPSELPKEIRKALKKQGAVRVDAEVAPGLAKVRRIVRVRLAGEGEW